MRRISQLQPETAPILEGGQNPCATRARACPELDGFPRQGRARDRFGEEHSWDGKRSEGRCGEQVRSASADSDPTCGSLSAAASRSATSLGGERDEAVFSFEGSRGYGRATCDATRDETIDTDTR